MNREEHEAAAGDQSARLLLCLLFGGLTLVCDAKILGFSATSLPLQCGIQHNA